VGEKSCGKRRGGLEELTIIMPQTFTFLMHACFFGLTLILCCTLPFELWEWLGFINSLDLSIFFLVRTWLLGGQYHVILLVYINYNVRTLALC